jgi:gliding motility-associated protein GldL
MVQNTNAYSNWYDSFEGHKENKFMTWYHSYTGKKWVNIIYSMGAAVVIVGALFKIMHWPGAGIVLTLGMCTEAFLFTIGVLEAPHEEFHWANVFPELLEYGSPDERIARSKAQLGMSTGKGEEKAGSVLDDKEMKALKEGIANLATTANQLSDLGKLATSTTKLGEKLDAAGEAAGKYAAGAEALGQKQDELNNTYATIVNDMQGVVAGTKEYNKSIAAVGAKLGEVNAVYELQLSALQAQAEAYKAQVAEVEKTSKQLQAVNADMTKLQTSTAEALKNQQAYEEANKKLAAQVADLNKVYGNMLSALA